jgi:hypothetical protein
MKSLVTLFSSLFAVSAFAQTPTAPAKPASADAKPAAAAPAKKEEAKPAAPAKAKEEAKKDAAKK